jgi:hypothetical protein
MKDNMLFSKPLFKGLFIAAFPLLIAGCAPPALQLAAWAVDGLLYATTGKSASDHVVSVAANKDCAMWRVIKGEEICSEITFENDDILVAMGDDETLNRDGLGAIAERLSARERAASRDITTESTKTPVYHGVQSAELKFGETALSPSKKHYSLSAVLAEADAASGTATDVSDDFLSQEATESADDNQEDSISPIITAAATFGRPLSLTNSFIRWSLRKRNTLRSPSSLVTYPFGRPMHTDFLQPHDLAPEPAVKLAPERAELQDVNISSRDSSNSGLRQRAGLSVADDSLFSVAAISSKTPAGYSKITTVDPAIKQAIKPVPDDLSRYLVLGSFSNRHNADAFSRKLGVFKASVVSTQLRGATYYRVFARPSSGESLEGLKSRYSEATRAKSWVTTLPEHVSSKTAALR